MSKIMLSVFCHLGALVLAQIPVLGVLLFDESKPIILRGVETIVLMYTSMYLSFRLQDDVDKWFVDKRYH